MSQLTHNQNHNYITTITKFQLRCNQLFQSHSATTISYLHRQLIQISHPLQTHLSHQRSNSKQKLNCHSFSMLKNTRIMNIKLCQIQSTLFNQGKIRISLIQSDFMAPRFRIRESTVQFFTFKSNLRCKKIKKNIQEGRYSKKKYIKKNTINYHLLFSPSIVQFQTYLLKKMTQRLYQKITILNKISCTIVNNYTSMPIRYKFTSYM
eukprot:TRINITY_DN1700_c1_g1_i15.p1 TRINITY_DN1700_c1_g1~~TRINITY_DN1700_c1_g1_i15.p1  ORF type:complete len:207 (+),score=-26.83 TRINITY_DN1700_c1_g1_i15:187-807(+)